jgi:hypothetical protein
MKLCLSDQSMLSMMSLFALIHAVPTFKVFNDGTSGTFTDFTAPDGLTATSAFADFLGPLLLTEPARGITDVVEQGVVAIGNGIAHRGRDLEPKWLRIVGRECETGLGSPNAVHNDNR